MTDISISVELYKIQCGQCYKDFYHKYIPFLCPWCGERFDHTVTPQTELQTAILKLKDFVVEAQADLRETLKANNKRWGGGWYDKDYETQPFISETVLYALLGKEDARTVLAYFNRIKELAGLSR